MLIIIILFQISICIIHFILTNANNNVPTYQINGLQALYNWNWDRLTDRWDFTNPIVNPCLDNWQGLTCNSNCSSIDSIK